MKIQMLLLVLMVILIFLFTGCAVVQQRPVVAVAPLRLSCETIPEIVDGNLDTAGALKIDAYVERKVIPHPRLGARRGFIPSTQVVGSKRAEAIIKLDRPTYITNVEVYAADEIRDILLYTVTEEPKPGFELSFSPVTDRHVGEKIGKGQVQKFRIGQKIFYLRLTAEGIEDSSQSTKTGYLDVTRSTTPLKGANVREVKFYEIPTTNP